jgi:glycosyltransferase involved in cell wall biosynthesis
VSMNILFTISSSEVGGAQRWVRDQAKVVSSIGHSYLATNEHGWLVESSEFHDVLLHRGFSKYLSPGSLISLLRFLRNNDIDLIVASSASAGVLSRIASLLSGIPVVYISHGWSAVYQGRFLKPFLCYSERILSLITHKIVCVSQSDLSIATDIISINKSKLVFFPNRVLPSPLLESHVKGNNLTRVLTVCRLAHPKRVDLLVDAMSGIKAELFVVGGGPLASQLLEKAEMFDNVTFVGEVVGFNEFSDYDVFVLISDSEGMPMSALEAMSAGLPLVLSNVGGCPSLIEGNGCLVSNDIASVRAGIVRAIENIDAYSNASIELFDSRYNLLRFSNSYTDFYKDCITR